jgi:hypothetical protein
MSVHAAPELEFGPTLLRGLVTLEPGDAGNEDLTLTLGLSLWLHRSGTDLQEARAAMLEIRALLLEVGGMDRRTEPVPLFGRSERIDVLLLASYLGDLVLRAAATAQCAPQEIVDRTVARLAPQERRTPARPARAG